MGISGLMSFVTQRSETFSKKLELHDTKLVIDGNCIALQLYTANNCNYCFGGDYGEYAYYVSEFFDELLKCNITPLIIFDGGLEDKKFDTILSRSEERLRLVSYSTPANEQQLIPTLTKDIFKYIAQKNKIKVVQSSFEADDQIAGIARILKCPVLSNDSDFLIFDVMYIPSSSLESGIFRSTNGQGFVKKCRVYTNEDFINNFPGMDKKNLPLAAALLGNDYIDSEIFNNFFSSVSISNTNNKHEKIEQTFKWLQHHALDHAMEIIMDQLNPEECQLILETIEMVINGYFLPASEMLKPLGYTSKEIDELTAMFHCVPYKFNWLGTSKLTEQDMLINTLSLNEDNILKQNVKSKINESIPTWFLYEYNAANFPAYFMDILNRQLIVSPEQMEDQRQPACIFISLKIIRVIFKLLSGGTSNSKMLEYIARGKRTNVTTYRLDCSDGFFNNQKLPTLENLIQLSKLERKEILISTLQVSDELIMKFPPTWRLYIAVIKYWSANADKIFVTERHLYSLIMMLVYHVVKTVIQHGLYFGRSTTATNQIPAYKNAVQSQILVDMPVKTALENVQKADCIKIEEFFKSHMNKSGENFDITIVHAFSLLQISLRFGMHLNALLGYPYPSIDISGFFSGTMIYNFYKDLKKYKQLNQRIKDIFADSPSILQLFVSTSINIQAVLKK